MGFREFPSQQTREIKGTPRKPPNDFKKKKKTALPCSNSAASRSGSLTQSSWRRVRHRGEQRYKMCQHIAQVRLFSSNETSSGVIYDHQRPRSQGQCKSATNLSSFWVGTPTKLLSQQQMLPKEATSLLL